jgi:ABC-type glycerol-3-phosphate transport system substrate-binding protein
MLHFVTRARRANAAGPLSGQPDTKESVNVAKPIHELYDDYTKGRISRRDLLKRTAAAGVATSAVVSFLDNPQGAMAASKPRVNLTRMAAQTTKMQPPAAGIDTSEQLIFRGWNYRPEVVQDNTAKFNTAYTENVDYQTITGDYIGIMENFHITGQPLDMAYSNPATLFRWSVPGWVHDYEAWWSVDDARGELYDGVRDSMTIDGKLYGLPYFVSCRGTMATNKVILDKAGVTAEQYPKTWTELYDMCRQLKSSGAADVPLLPHWFTAGVWFGVSWGYLFECLNRGAVLFDDANVPVFDDASLAILNEWKGLLDEGLVPESVFTMGEADWIDAFAKGTYAFSPQQIYDLKVFNDPTKSQIAGQCVALPVNGQPWGMIDEGIYSIPNRNDSEEKLARKYRLGGFFGYRDDQNNLAVAKRWAIEAALNSGYKSILEDQEVIDAYNSWLPNPEMLATLNGVLEAAPFAKVWQTFWWEEWNAQAMTDLPKAILGQSPVEEIHAGLKSLAEELVERYQF